ncbi:Uncharacterised protein [Vibrio cholerae]|nr:Uncharacterised protein [Vibrio cholerae]
MIGPNKIKFMPTTTMAVSAAGNTRLSDSRTMLPALFERVKCKTG